MAKPKEKTEEQIPIGADNTDGQTETPSTAPNEPGPAVETAEGGNQRERRLRSLSKNPLS